MGQVNSNSKQQYCRFISSRKRGDRFWRSSNSNSKKYFCSRNDGATTRRGCRTPILCIILTPRLGGAFLEGLTLIPRRLVLVVVWSIPKPREQFRRPWLYSNSKWFCLYLSRGCSFEVDNSDSTYFVPKTWVQFCTSQLWFQKKSFFLLRNEGAVLKGIILMPSSLVCPRCSSERVNSNSK